MSGADYAPQLPEVPPEGLVEWLLKKGLLKKELLIYKADWYREPLSGEREQAVKLTCTACHGSMYADKMPREGRGGGPAFGFRHPETLEVLGDGGHCLCPMCGAEAEIRHVGNMGRWNCEEAYPMTAHRVPGEAGERDRLALCGWCVRKWFEKGGRSGITVWPLRGLCGGRKEAGPAERLLQVLEHAQPER